MRGLPWPFSRNQALQVVNLSEHTSPRHCGRTSKNQFTLHLVLVTGESPKPFCFFTTGTGGHKIAQKWSGSSGPVLSVIWPRVLATYHLASSYIFRFHGALGHT